MAQHRISEKNEERIQRFMKKKYPQLEMSGRKSLYQPNFTFDEALEKLLTEAGF